MNRRGFTLIELLVVIAILGLLAAILFPVFARARESARRTVCRSNLKQIGNAMMMYYQDYDEQLMPAISVRCDCDLNYLIDDRVGPIALGLLFCGYIPWQQCAGIMMCPDDYEMRAITEAVVYYVGEGMRLGPRCIQDVSSCYVYRGPLDLSQYPDLALVADDFILRRLAPSVPLHTSCYHEIGYNVLYADGHVKFCIDGGRVSKNSWSNTCTWANHDYTPVWSFFDEKGGVKP
ncbi:MAG: type II secretion system GspH family protein, partial [Armatimonadetes bacterium]|nr:type II secretion system GspH family protein [Armatimonadota bacterium]